MLLGLPVWALGVAITFYVIDNVPEEGEVAYAGLVLIAAALITVARKWTLLLIALLSGMLTLLIIFGLLVLAF